MKVSSDDPNSSDPLIGVGNLVRREKSNQRLFTKNGPANLTTEKASQLGLDTIRDNQE